MSLTRKHLEPAATSIGAAMLAAGVTDVHDLPEPARSLALDWRRQCAQAAARFDFGRFDAWTLDVATGRRSPVTGARVKATA